MLGIISQRNIPAVLSSLWNMYFFSLTRAGGQDDGTGTDSLRYADTITFYKYSPPNKSSGMCMIMELTDSVSGNITDSSTIYEA